MFDNLDNKKILTFGLFIVAVLIGLQIFSLKYAGKEKTPATSDEQLTVLGEAKLVLERGDGSFREFAGPVVSGMSVWSALLQSAAAGSISIDYEIREGEVFLKAIDGKGKVSGAWFFYHNGRLLAGPEIMAETILPGDIVRVVYAPK